jgi:hypothetical protein
MLPRSIYVDASRLAQKGRDLIIGVTPLPTSKEMDILQLSTCSVTLSTRNQPNHDAAFPALLVFYCMERDMSIRLVENVDRTNPTWLTFGNKVAQRELICRV